jgi:WD40 repeat protein
VNFRLAIPRGIASRVCIKVACRQTEIAMRRLGLFCIGLILLSMLALGFSDSPKPVELEGKHIFVGFTNSETPKNSKLVTCDADGVVRFYTPEFREESRRQIPNVRGIVRFAFSERTDAFCAEAATGDVIFGRFSNCEVTRRVKFEFLYDRVGFSHDGRLLSFTSGGPIRLFRVTDFNEVKIPEPLMAEKHKVGTSVVLVRRNGDDVIVAANILDAEVESYVLETGDTLPPFRSDEPKDKKFVDLVADPKDGFVVAANMVSELVWDLQSGRQIRRLPGFDTGIGNRLAVSGDGTTIVYAKALHSDRSRAALRAFRTSDWKQISETVFTAVTTKDEAESNQVSDVSVSHDGSLAATLHGDGMVRVWTIPHPSSSK